MLKFFSDSGNPSSPRGKRNSFLTVWTEELVRVANSSFNIRKLTNPLLLKKATFFTFQRTRKFWNFSYSLIFVTVSPCFSSSSTLCVQFNCFDAIFFFFVSFENYGKKILLRKVRSTNCYWTFVAVGLSF